MRRFLPLIITIIVILGIFIGIRAIEQGKIRQQDKETQERMRQTQEAYDKIMGN